MPPFDTVRAVARVRAPAEEKEEVAVPPKYAVPKLDKFVVEAPAEKSCRAFQVFVAERRAFDVPRHVPMIETQPELIVIPLEKVEVAPDTASTEPLFPIVALPF